MEKDLEKVVTEGTIEKKKQKPGMNSIRPEDKIEENFKKMAKENDLSQTQLFELMFRTYIKKGNEDKLNEELDLSSEIRLIAMTLNNASDYFKNAIQKAQNIVHQQKENQAQLETVKNLEIDTLNKKIAELEKRNAELEQSNNVFNEVKSNLENKIAELEKENNEKNDKIKEFEQSIKLKDTESKNLNLQLEKVAKENKEIRKESDSKDNKIKNLQSTNSSLQTTINTFESLKNAQISATESKFKDKVTALEDKIKDIEKSNQEKIKTLEDTLSKTFEADKKMAVADITLKLADVTTKYNNSVEELHKLKSKSRNN